MPSPFPGMDPYLEDPDMWPDFHVTFLVALRAELNLRILPERYVASIGEYRWERSDSRPNRYLTIHEVRNGPTRTVIELVGPLQKMEGLKRQRYLSRREQYLANGFNLIEIDLTRTGSRVLSTWADLPPHDYLIAETRADEPRQNFVWPLSLREPLPTIGIPLDETLPGVPVILRRTDLALSLQRCLDSAYDDARYQRILDYDAPPDPPLHEPDATWARELIAKRKPTAE